MSRQKPKSEPRRRAASSDRLARPAPGPWKCAQCQPLEARRLLAVMFDPSFGGGDGMTLMPSQFALDPDIENPFFPRFVSRLSGGYFTKGGHFTPDPVEPAQRAFHSLVEENGTISTDLVRDSDEDGFVFYPQDDFDEFPFGVGDYSDYFPLDDGSGLARLNEPADSGIADRVVRVLPNGRESPFFKIDGIGEIHAIERLSSTLGVLLASNEAPGAIEPIDPSELIYTVHLFDLVTGELLDDAQPFGDWLRLDRLVSTPTLNVGRDAKVYVGSLSVDLDGADGNPDDGGFILTRMQLQAGELRHDTSFGAAAQLPGQKTRAAYLSSSFALDLFGNSFLLAGTTDQGRAWIKMPHPQSGQNALAFALLTSSGALDTAFGTDGVVEVDFPSVEPSFINRADASPGFVAARGGVTGAPAPFVRGDGSLLGLVTLAAGADIPAGSEFALGVYGLLPDGSLDTRIAESGSIFGAGRAIIATQVDGDPEVTTGTTVAAAFLDDAERLVISGGTYSDEEGAVASLVYARILLGTPRMEVVERPNGDRVLEIEGTSGDDRYIFRPGFPGFELFQQPIGALPSSIARFASDVDRVEIMGGEGNDLLFSEVSTFSGFITVTGGLGDDTLSANGRFDRIFGDEGNDSLLGGLGAQLIFGGAGNDTLAGGSGRDALFGEEGDDVLHGQSEGDFLSGGDGNDLLFGHVGNDTLEGGLGDDTLDGGDEIDLLSYASHALPVVASLFDGTGGAAGEQDTLVTDTLERILGTSGDDLLTGNNGRNFLAGGDGNDTLQGLGGDDTLLGGEGADVLDGGVGDDLLVDFTPLGLGGGPDVFIGGGGFDFALADDEDDADEDVEGVFNDLGALLTAIDQRNAPPA